MDVKIRLNLDSAAVTLDDDGLIDEVEMHRILCSIPPKITKILGRSPNCICDAPEADDVLKDTNGNTVGAITLISSIDKDPEIRAAATAGYRKAGLEVTRLSTMLPTREKRVVKAIGAALQAESDLEVAAMFAIRYNEDFGEEEE